METNKSKVIVLGSVALGLLLIAGMGILMFGKDPTATPRQASGPAGTAGQDATDTDGVRRRTGAAEPALETAPDDQNKPLPAPGTAAERTRLSSEPAPNSSGTSNLTTSQPRQPATGEPAGSGARRPASAAGLGVRAPQEFDPDQKEPDKEQSAGRNAHSSPASQLPAQDQWNNERNTYTIQFQEKLNQLEYRTLFVSQGMPIERARHAAVIKLYKDSIDRMQSGEADNLSKEVKRVQEEEKQIMRGAKDSELSAK